MSRFIAEFLNRLRFEDDVEASEFNEAYQEIAEILFYDDAMGMRVMRCPRNEYGPEAMCLISHLVIGRYDDCFEIFRTPKEERLPPRELSVDDLSDALNNIYEYMFGHSRVDGENWVGERATEDILRVLFHEGLALRAHTMTN